jgi:hypothetical protein
LRHERDENYEILSHLIRSEANDQSDGKGEDFGWIRAKLFAYERNALKLLLAFIKVGNFCPQ